MEKAASRFRPIRLLRYYDDHKYGTSLFKKTPLNENPCGTHDSFHDAVIVCPVFWVERESFFYDTSF